MHFSSNQIVVLRRANYLLFGMLADRKSCDHCGDRTLGRLMPSYLWLISTDCERFEEAKLELTNLLRLTDLPQYVPVLLLANKQDLPQAAPLSEIEGSVGIGDLSKANHPCRTLCCCAVTGEGLDDCFDVLHELIQDSKRLANKAKRKSRWQEVIWDISPRVWNWGTISG